jgi:CheY-like chemotaxis protein
VALPLIASPGATTLRDLRTQAAPGQLGPGAPPVAVLAALRGRILLAEDGPDNQRLISFYLTKAGASVEIAENGRIALEKLMNAASSANPFDLLLTDMQMPEMDGYTLASEVRQRGLKIPIIALTAHAMAEDRQQCLDAGCDDYAAKPVDRAHLLKICAAWLSGKSKAAA